MPIKLIPPRAATKQTSWYVRGTYLGVFVDRSTKTPERRIANIVLKRWRKEIECGSYQDPRAPVVSPDETPTTFLAAAVAYMRSGGERAYVGPILKEWGEMPLSRIDQVLIDMTAEKLYPGYTASTKNRQFYTPVSAILKRAGIERYIKRPKGWRGKKSTSWLEPEQAFRLFDEADKINLEFGLFLRTLCYTGMRLSEASNIKMGHVDLSRQFIYLPETKNGEARSVYLPPILITAFANHPRGMQRDPHVRLFRFHKGGRLYDMLKDAMTAARLAFPRRQGGFHLFCHTYGTWMHRYAGLDNYALSRTDRWKDPRSAERYLHTEINSEARMADIMPVKRARP